MRTIGLALGLMALFAVGCSDHTTSPTARIDVSHAPAFTIDNAPAASGIVMRGESSIGVGWPDFKAGTSVYIGFDPAELCTWTFDFDLVPFQEVHANGGQRVLRHVQGRNLTTSVWPFIGFNCGLFTSVAPLARGVSDLNATDNDVFVSGPVNANAFGYRAHGKLTRASGADAAFSAHANWRINHTGMRVNSRISLH